MILAALLFLSGLSISAVAIYYSVVGLTAIFSAAAFPIMIMGISLEVGKLVIASWVKAYWSRIPILMRTYAVAGVVVLMVITSLGIFGFLSKAHSDQTLVSGDVQSKIALYDEKIQTSKDNIDANRRALKQMDEAVDQSMARSTDEKGADKAVAIRRSQQKERQRLQSEITAEQTRINQLVEERAPIATEVRKVEAEVGPIKYLAAFVYGENPDASILERAVTWVIILIVIVFDPLAVVMLLAAQMTWTWNKEPRGDKFDDFVAEMPEATIDAMIDQEQQEEIELALSPSENVTESQDISVAYLSKPFKHFENLEPMPAPTPVCEPPVESVADDTSENNQHLQQELAEAQSNIVELANYVQHLQVNYESVSNLHQQSMTREAALIEENANLKEQLSQAMPEKDDQNAMAIIAPEDLGIETRPFTADEIAALDSYNDQRLVSIFDKIDSQPIVLQPLENDTQQISESVDHAIESEVGTQRPDSEIQAIGVDVLDRPGDYITDPVVPEIIKRDPKTGFGNTFAHDPERGDFFIRTDFRPSRLFKWNGVKWIQVNKSTTDAYAYNDAYIQFLAEQVMTGAYSWDELTQTEIEQVQTLTGGRRG